MSWTQPGLEAVAGLVSRRTGITFGGRTESAELGICRAMARARMTDPQRFLEIVEADSLALDELISELTVGETYFFRESGQFDLIRQKVLPEIRRRRGKDHVIRAWSAGCATGEEVYSLAILLEKEGMGTRSHLLATDICQRALAKAERGHYGQWSMRGDMAKDALPYLAPLKNGYLLDESIRRRVNFASLNLALDAYPSFAAGVWGMDLILCRNVLIYLDRETIGKAARRFYQTLAEGGWLITAAADPLLWEEAPFQVVTTEQGLLYRRTGAVENATGKATDLETSFFLTESAAMPTPDYESRSMDFEPLASESTQDDETPTRCVSEGPPSLAHRVGVFGRAVGNCANGEREMVRGESSPVEPFRQAPRDDAEIAVRNVRALANVDLAAAERACSEAVIQHRFSSELNYLHAVLFLEIGREEDAVRAVRRVLYLDRSLAMAHFTLGSLLRRRGDLAGAGRAFRNARDLCAARPADELLPLADGEPAGRLTEAAEFELARLKSLAGAQGAQVRGEP